MNSILEIRRSHDTELERVCRKYLISFASIQILLDAEKTKKLLKRSALIQTSIDREINGAIENENR
jgi:hypothetical protein